jgi:transcriptional regulator GlxA family with amidase domain
MATSTSKLVVITVLPGSRLLTLAGPADVFSFAQQMLETEHGGHFKGYEVVTASATHHKEVRLNSAGRFIADTTVHDIDREIDTLILIGARLEDQPDSDQFYDWLVTHAPKIRRVAGVCVATFVLAKAGLLHNKRATTHWERNDDLQRQYPDIIVDTTPFFIKHDNIYTAGGVTSGMDLSLALVKEDYGRDIALRVARKLVVHLKRPGNQKQFGGLLPDYELGSPLLAQLRPWLLERLHENMNVNEMAAQCHMSARNFARVFLKETAFTPAKFLEKLRVEMARNYLENSALSLEEIALRCGLGSLVSMRRVFLRHLEISPGTYRSTFRTALHTD